MTRTSVSKPERQRSLFEWTLTEEIKVLDTKLDTHADLFQPPSFPVAMNQPAQENSGNYLMTIGFNPAVDARRTSVVLELTDAK